jgi:integrase
LRDSRLDSVGNPKLGREAAMSGRGVNATGETRPYQRKCDGRWFATYYVDGKLKNVSAKTEREVVVKRRRARSRVAESPTAGALTVAEMADRWLATLSDPLSLNHVAPVAVVSYTSVVKRHIRPAPFGDIPVDGLTSGDVESLLAAKVAAGLGRSLVSRVRRHLKQILDEGIRSGFVNKNVAAAARMPKERRHASEQRALTADQAKALLAVVRGDRFECAIKLMLALGLRKGEVLGLQWEDIDWYAQPEPILHVRHALRRERDALGRGPSRLVLGEVKGRGRSKGDLPLEPSVVKALRDHREQQEAERFNAYRWDETGYVFVNTIGRPVEPGQFNARVFDKACAKAGIGHWRPHETRHSFISLGIECYRRDYLRTTVGAPARIFGDDFSLGD